jgi:hypothetical protein
MFTHHTAQQIIIQDQERAIEFKAPVTALLQIRHSNDVMKRLQPRMLFPLRALACNANTKDINTAYTKRRVFPGRVSGAIGEIIICKQPTATSDDTEFPDCPGLCGVQHN